jgi:hypothetical protein
MLVTIIPASTTDTASPLEADTPVVTTTPAPPIIPSPYSIEAILLEYPLDVGVKWIYEVDFKEHNIGVIVAEWQGQIEEEVSRRTLGSDGSGGESKLQNFICILVAY